VAEVKVLLNDASGMLDEVCADGYLKENREKAFTSTTVGSARPNEGS
jgi:hypothetical protein